MEWEKTADWDKECQAINNILNVIFICLFVSLWLPSLSSVKAQASEDMLIRY